MLSGSGLLVEAQETVPYLLVEGGVLAEPLLAELAVYVVPLPAEPEFEDVLGLQSAGPTIVTPSSDWATRRFWSWEL